MGIKILLIIGLAILLTLGLLFYLRGFQKGLHIVKDVYYAGVEDEYRSLDIYVPRCDGGKRPVVFFVHGGAWMAGDKREHASKGLFFAKQGYVFVNVNYRLAPSVSYPDFAYDVAQALAWVYQHIGDYCGDRDRIYLMGHSAGGHLVALISYDPKFLGRYGLSPSIIKGLILLDGGGFDLVKTREEFPFLYKTLHEKAFGTDEETLRDASPIYHLGSAGYIPPTFVIYTDWKATKSNAEWLIAALEAAGAEYTSYYAEGKTHDTVSKDIGKPGDAVTQKILEFIESHP